VHIWACLSFQTSDGAYCAICGGGVENSISASVVPLHCKSKAPISLALKCSRVMKTESLRLRKTGSKWKEYIKQRAKSKHRRAKGGIHTSTLSEVNGWKQTKESNIEHSPTALPSVRHAAMSRYDSAESSGIYSSFNREVLQG